MRIIVLGSGMDASQIPGIPNRFSPGFLIEWGKSRLLLECPESVRFRLEEAGVDYASIRHLAVSHSHPDHYALPQYLQSVWNKGYLAGWHYCKHDLKIYGPSVLVKKIRALLRYYRPETPDFLAWPRLKFKSLPAKTAFTVKGLKITAMRVCHGAGKLESLAFRFEHGKKSIVYSGDTGYCKNIIKIAKNADVLLSECSNRIGFESDSHLTPKQAGKIAEQSNVKKLVLTHYSGLDTDKQMIIDCRRSGYKGKIIVAKDFQIIE